MYKHNPQTIHVTSETGKMLVSTDLYLDNSIHQIYLLVSKADFYNCVLRMVTLRSEFVCPFHLLAIVCPSIQSTDSDYPFDIFKLFLLICLLVTYSIASKAYFILGTIVFALIWICINVAKQCLCH